MANWNEKLINTAHDGDIEAVKLCLQNGADIDYQNRVRVSALIKAVGGGHLELTRFLLDSGCNPDLTDVGGSTALLTAGWLGWLEVTRLLLDRGCNANLPDKGGETALHLSAQDGHLQTTRCLVEQGGISPLVKSHEGQTPYDLAAAKKKRQYKEVMEYLQSVTARQRMEDDIVPTEIKSMADKRSVPLYLKLLDSGSEKKRDIRLVIVGKKGAGKTSMIKRLFSEENTDVTSTNGIEIHTVKCKAMSDDGIWNKLDGTNEEIEIHARLLKQYKGKIEASVEEGTPETVKENSPSTSFDESKEPETVIQQHVKIEQQVTPESQVEHQVTSQQPNQSLEQAQKDIEIMLKSNVDLHDKEEYATLLLWDFAGDEEFYHTHQTFLSSGAIYLVVTKLNEADDKNAQDLFQLWIDSIHCYSRLEEDTSNSADSKTSDDLDPPVVIVGTWRDAVTSDIEEIDDACRENIFKYTKNMTEDEQRHIRQEYFISNTEDDPNVFQQIREDILNLARKMKTWNKEYPLKFIQLEKRLQEKKKELPIISFNEIKHISTDTANPLNDEELSLFLEFHHEIRALVYFKDLPSYIILDTQWLSDAFRCIVTAKKFRTISFRHRTKWDELSSRGKLHNEVLDDIFRKSENTFSKHKDHILNVMEKFDIIIRPNISGTERDAGDDKPLYYIPCMITSEPECDIYEMFNVTENTCTKSTWLCYMFRFLPPHLMNHLIASLCRKYKVAEVVTKAQKKQIALFRSSAVFELEKTTKLAKLHIMKCPNWIQIQVWQFGKEREGGLYKYIDDFVTEEIAKIINTRFKMSNVNFWKNWECGLTKPESVTGSNDFSEEQIPEYYCEKCTSTHIFIDEWQDLNSRRPCLPISCEIKPGLNQNRDSISHAQTISSKMVLPPVLKKRYSLKGRKLVPLIKRIRLGQPESFKGLARMNKELKTENLNMEEIAQHVKVLTGEDLDEICQLSGRSDDDVGEARWILHSLIIYANEFGQPKGQDLQVSEGDSTPIQSTSDMDTQPKAGKRKPDSSTASDTLEDRIASLEKKTKVEIITKLKDKLFFRINASNIDISNIHDESTAAASLTGFTKEEINFSKMGMIALNILADVLYDLLKPDRPYLRSRCDCDITYLYSEHRNLNKHIPSNSWGGPWQRIQTTDIAIGDDIERIRLTRNELQHSKIFHLDDKRFNELRNILSDLLKRFDQHNKPARLYTDHLNEILAKTISAEEVKSIKNEIGMAIEVEIEHQINVSTQ